MASRMRVTSLMDEARCYEALPITAKTIGHRTQDGQDGTLDCRISEGLSMCEGQVRARSNPNSYLARARTREPRHRDESGWGRKNALQRLRLLRKFVEQLFLQFHGCEWFAAKLLAESERIHNVTNVP